MIIQITEQEMADAREAWASALIAISKAYEDEGIDAARELAGKVLDMAYGYGLGPVLFKPTLASGEQTFRPTREGALSYFVGNNKDYPLDAGFGVMGWRTVEYETSASFIHGDVAIWMGRAIFTNKDGSVTMADKSWGYKRDEAGDLRIVLHHSSLPYEPA